MNIFQLLEILTIAVGIGCVRWQVKGSSNALFYVICGILLGSIFLNSGEPDVFSLVEFVATMMGIICVWLQVKQNSDLWFYGIVSAALLGVLYFHQGFYAFCVFQIYYVIASMYGLWEWKRGKAKSENPIRRLSGKQAVVYAVVTMLIFLGITGALHLLGSEVAVSDAVLTTLSAVATWMLARKIFEQWYVWFVCDFINAIVVFQQGLYFATILYTAYVAMIILGIREWKQTMATQQAEKI